MTLWDHILLVAFVHALFWGGYFHGVRCRGET